jgi:ATP-dependent exoDNAse (exonuclease V) beta subunit
VVSDESLLLINSPKINLIVSVLRTLANNDYRLAKAEALYNLSLIENRETGNLFLEPETFFGENIKPEIENKYIHNRSLYEIVEYLYRVFGLDDNADLYLTRFLDAVLDFSVKEGGEINSFLNWWDKNYEKYSVIVPGQEDAVRLMTIHKAKGLESRAVIIPFASWDTNLLPLRDHFWVSTDKKPFDESTAFLVRAENELKESYFSADYDNEYIMTNIDNLNLIYVSFTRAMERMYVISPPGWGKKNTNILLKTAFESDFNLQKLMISENIYEYGTKSKAGTGKQKKISAESIFISSITSADFREKTVIKPVYEELSFVSAENYFNSIYRGLLLHKLLSYIYTPKDIETALNKVLPGGLYGESFRNDLKKELIELINHKDISAWFNEDLNVKTEAELITADPENPVIRPDRVIINNDELIVIDYKTGKERDEDSKQVKYYSGLLAGAGYKKVDAYLLYLNSKAIVKVK